MRKHLLLIVLLALAFRGYSQNRFTKMILGEQGMSQHFVRVPENVQVNFDPAHARAFFGLDANSDLVLMNKATDEIGQTHYRYFQTYKGIPVENSMYVVNTTGLSLNGMNGVIVVNFDMKVQQQRPIASINLQQAINSAAKIAGVQQYMWEDAAKEKMLEEQSGFKSSYKPAATLVWYSPNGNLNNKNLILAYKVDVYSKKPLSRADYYIDANTGAFLGKNDKIQYADATGTANTEYSGSQTIHSTLKSTKYILRDGTKGGGVITLHGDSDAGTLDYTSTSKNWSLSGQDRHAMDVHWGVEKTYDFYKSKFGRNSLDNSGFTLVSYVNVGIVDNAYWDGSSMNFGILSSNSKGVTAIDVTGHELTHGVTQFTCGLQYSYESGAINESLSDIMGKSVQFYAKPTDINWKLSNDMGWIIRDMSKPNAEYQPDTYQGTYWYEGSSDNGGVHTNSGLGNFMFYLLVNGGSGTNDYGDSYSVTGIGLDNAQKIIYRSQTVYLTPTSTYSDWREACINAATDLYGATSTQAKQVKNAWFAVGLGRYCQSVGSTTYMYIKKVKFGSISNLSGDNGGYHNYTSLSTSVTKGTAVQILLTPGFSSTVYGVNWTVYIDFNRDNDFDDDNETVVTGSTSSTSALNRYVVIPSTAATGKTRMRVQMSYYGGEGPCGTISYGEVEDYSVNISAPAAIALNNAAITTLPNEEKLVVTISPNPVRSSEALVSYTTTHDGNVAIKMVDVYGRYVQMNNVGFQKAGNYTYRLERLNAIAPGNYFVVVEQNNAQSGKAKLLIAR